jgi:hypothetical protein
MKQILIKLGSILTLVLIILTSCSTEKKLQKAINKHGQKESVEYVVKKYPEYFNNFLVKDTVEVLLKDTVIVEETFLDTIFVADVDGTYVAENESLKLQITKLNNKLKAKVNVKPKEIIVEKEIKVPVQIEKPCPDLQIFQNNITELNYKIKSQKKVINGSILFNIFLLLLVAFMLYNRYTKK